jgi:tetratricopeptide (TPR) repeat protein
VEQVAWLTLMVSFVVICGLVYGFRNSVMGQFQAQRFDTLLDEARDFDRSSEPERAEDVYATLLERYPDNEELLVAYAEHLESNGQTAEAETALARAAALGRQRFSAVRRYAAFLERTNRTEEAAAFLEKYLAQFPDDYTAQHDLGLIYMRLQRWQDAVGSLQRATQRPELEFAARSNLAGTYIQLGQIENAVQEWRRIVAMGPEPEFQQFLQNIAVAYENLDLPESACEAWQSFLERFPNSILGAQRVLALADRCGTAEMRERAALRLKALSPELRIGADLSPNLRVAGVSQEAGTVLPGSTITLEVWFEIIRTARNPSFVRFSLVDSGNAGTDLLSEPNAVGTSPLWRGDTVRQPFAITIPEDVTPGSYSLQLHSREDPAKAVTIGQVTLGAATAEAME